LKNVIKYKQIIYSILSFNRFKILSNTQSSTNSGASLKRVPGLLLLVVNGIVFIQPIAPMPFENNTKA